MEYLYKWIHFTLDKDTGKTKVFKCYSNENKGLLGYVKWFGAFRKYSFFPERDVVFESQCLTDITRFLEKLMIERKIDQQVKKNA